MTPWGFLRSLLIALQGEEDPSAAAAGFALGAALGLLPSGNLIAAAVLILLFFFRADKSLAVMGALLFTPVGLLLDAPAHAVGAALLTAAPLAPVWTALYNAPLLPWTRFNNTVVLGQLVFGAALFYPMYRLSLRGVAEYRARYKPVVDRWPIVRAVKSWTWVQRLQTLNEKTRDFR